MKIKGREIKFLKTVKSTCDIEDLCPNHDISRFPELMGGSVKTVNTTVAKLIHILNEGYEMNRQMNEEGYKANILAEEEILYLDDATFTALAEEMMQAFNGQKPTVETEDSKKNEVAE